MAHANPDAVETKIIELFKAEEGALAPDGISRLEILPTQTMTADDTPKPRKLVLAFDFKTHADKRPDDVMAAIKKALGKVSAISSTFHGLEPELSVRKKIEALTAKYSSKDIEHGLLPQEVTALASWPYAKRDSNRFYFSDGPAVESDTQRPLSISYSEFPDGVAADEAKQNLESRKAAILAKIIEMASPHLNEVQKQELTKLRLDIVESKSGSDWNNVCVVVGIPDETAPQKNADGQAPLKASAALNSLMEKHAVEGDTVSVGETIIRHAATYAGEKWQDVFHLLAGPKEMKGYLESRIKQLKNEELKTQLHEFLKDPLFLTAKAREEQGHHPQADSALNPPNSDHPTSYRVPADAA